jgi:predicted RNA-binding protein with PIN domain
MLVVGRVYIIGVRRSQCRLSLRYNASMPYLVDGHNLIPKAGLRLDASDDEMQLVAKLLDYCRIQRKQVEVYFDGAPPGQAQVRSFGSVKAHFIRLGMSADAAIVNRLEKLGRAARNWIVVSSDRQIQSAARAVQAQILSSEAFSGLMDQGASRRRTNSKAERQISPQELDDWLEEFGSNGHKGGQVGDLGE